MSKEGNERKEWKQMQIKKKKNLNDNEPQTDLNHHLH